MKTVLITGGSEGIGYQLAVCWAKDGNNLILCGRNAEKLQKAKDALQKQYGVQVDTIVADLAQKHAAAQLYEQTAGRQIDVLVNNAGCGYAGRAWEIDASLQEDMVVLNDAETTALCTLYLKDMVSRRSGTIVNVASTGAFQPGPYIAGYYASKSYMVSYTKALAEETKEYGILIYCLCPGPVDTGFYEKSGGHHPVHAMSPKDCAEYAYQRIGGRKVMIIPGLINRIVRILPESVRMHFVAKMKRRYLKEPES